LVKRVRAAGTFSGVGVSDQLNLRFAKYFHGVLQVGTEQRIDAHLAGAHPIDGHQVRAADDGVCLVGDGVGKDAERPVRREVAVK
jgi:hypothetical protein